MMKTVRVMKFGNSHVITLPKYITYLGFSLDDVKLYVNADGDEIKYSFTNSEGIPVKVIKCIQNGRKYYRAVIPKEIREIMNIKIGEEFLVMVSGSQIVFRRANNQDNHRHI